MKPKILMILSFPRSGSTVLGELINQGERFTHIGELERLWYLRNNPLSVFPQVTCSCGKKLWECNFWSPHFLKLEEEIRLLSEERNIDINNKFLLNVRNKYIRKGKLKRKEVDVYSEINNSLYRSLFEKNQEVIVDSSKELWYAKYLESTKLFDITYIHLVRDLRGVVLSRQRKMKKNSKNGSTINLNYKYLFYDSFRWNLINRRVQRFLKDKKKLEINYEEFLKQPKKLLEELGRFYKDGISPNVLDEQNIFNIQSNHLIHGNVFRFTRGEVKLKEDDRWKYQLSQKDKQIIKLLSYFKFKQNSH